MQASLFDPAPTVKSKPVKKKSVRVSRGKGLKRHPSRAPAKKRIVSTRPVRLQSSPDGPIGKIVDSITENSQRIVFIKWEGRSKISRHNPMHLETVLDKEERLE